MKNSQERMDKASIVLSVMCAAHCLLLPVVITLLPALADTPLAYEAFHEFLLVFVIPISIIALIIGCEKHRKWSNVFLGIVGLMLLVFSMFLGHHFSNVLGDECIILIGVAFICLSHIRNYNFSKLSQWEYV